MLRTEGKRQGKKPQVKSKKRSETKTVTWSKKQ